MQRRRLLFAAVVVMGELATVCFAQISNFPYTQQFDSVTVPVLPAGWTSTQNRSPGTNDFTTTTSTARSLPNAVLSTNSTIAQALTSPLFDFAGRVPDSLLFFTRRSSSHVAKVVVEASLDSGATFTIQLGDTLLNEGDVYVSVRRSLALIPPSSRRVKFRVRIIPSSTGTTGTFRIDDFSVTIQSPVDLSLARLSFVPSLPIEGDSVRAHVTIRNFGSQPAQQPTLQLYEDANNDSTPQPSELRSSSILTASILPNDSVTTSVALGVFAAGNRGIIARISHPLDQDTSNNKRFAQLSVGYREKSVIVNEIMYAPINAEPEWVELFNARSDSVNLRNWQISDNAVATKRTITTQNIFLPSGGFILLTRDSAALIDIHPNVRARIITVSSFPSLNNSGDAVVLYDNRAATMDSVAYLPSWGGSNGNSLERIDPFASSTLQTNWGASRSVARSTPGLRNSIVRKDRDLAMDSVRVSPLLPLAGDSVRFAIQIKNIGRDSASSFTVHLFKDANGDSVAQPSELVASEIRSALLRALDSLTVNLTVRNIAGGILLFIARVDFSTDEDTTNNIRLTRVIVGFPSGSVRINEIMYAPTSGVPEWIELINTRADTVELSKWLVGNRSTSSRYEITNARLPLAPNELVVVTKDTALFNNTYAPLTGRVVQTAALPTFLWNNSGDAVVLLDGRRVAIDSVFYLSSWGGNDGKSLERIDALSVANDSTNWATSNDSLGATPTRRNAQVALENDLRLVRVSSDTVAPGSRAHLAVVVSNVGKLACNQFELTLFDDINGDSIGTANERFASQIVNRTLARRESTIVEVEWNQPSSGIRRVVAQVNYTADERTSNNKGFANVRVGYAPRSLVINEIMFVPLMNNAEYIEFYNASERDIEVAQWKMHDRITSGNANEFKLATKSKIIRPGELFVLASDSSVMRLNSSLDSSHCAIVNVSSLSLNNDGDDIVLVDPAGLVNDSIRFSPDWHNPNVTDKTGRSLEKINPTLSSDDARNWTTCANANGGTPGNPNSVYTASPIRQSQLSISPNPFSPDGDGREDFAIILYEVPLTVSMVRVRIYDAVGRRIRTLANNELSAARGDIVWDGMDDDKQKARVGIYVVLLEAIDEAGGIVETVKGVVVVAAKL